MTPSPESNIPVTDTLTSSVKCTAKLRRKTLLVLLFVCLHLQCHNCHGRPDHSILQYSMFAAVQKYPATTSKNSQVPFAMHY